MPKGYPNRKKRGRPEKLSQEVTERFLKAMRMCGIKQYSCGYAGISTSTLGQWLKRGKLEHHGKYRQFLTDVRKAESDVKMLLTGRIIAQSATDWRAGEAALRRLDPMRWNNRIEIGGIKGGAAIEVKAAESNVLHELSDDELRAITASYDKARALAAKRLGDGGEGPRGPRK